MTTPEEDLWPDDLTENVPRTPTHILKEQAYALGQKMKNVVRAHIQMWSRSNDDNISLSLMLSTPAVRDYEYTLLTVRHDTGLYPVRVEADDDEETLDDEAAFKAHLKKVFNSDRTKRVVRALLAQARAEDYTPGVVVPAKRSEGFGFGGAGDDDIPF